MEVDSAVPDQPVADALHIHQDDRAQPNDQRVDNDYDVNQDLMDVDDDDEQQALTVVETIRQKFLSTRDSFVFPTGLLIADTTRTGHALAIHTSNLPVQIHELALGDLLIEVDKVESHGSSVIRASRKALVVDIEASIQRLKTQISQRLIEQQAVEVVEAIRHKFVSARDSFVFPTGLLIADTTRTGHALAIHTSNLPVQIHELALGDLLIEVDKVESHGSSVIRASRKALVVDIEASIQRLKTQISQRLIEQQAVEVVAHPSPHIVREGEDMILPSGQEQHDLPFSQADVESVPPGAKVNSTNIPPGVKSAFDKLLCSIIKTDAKVLRDSGTNNREFLTELANALWVKSGRPSTIEGVQDFFGEPFNDARMNLSAEVGTRNPHATELNRVSPYNPPGWTTKDSEVKIKLHGKENTILVSHAFNMFNGDFCPGTVIHNLAGFNRLHNPAGQPVQDFTPLSTSEHFVLFAADIASTKMHRKRATSMSAERVTNLTDLFLSTKKVMEARYPHRYFDAIPDVDDYEGLLAVQTEFLKQAHGDAKESIEPSDKANLTGWAVRADYALLTELKIQDPEFYDSFFSEEVTDIIACPDNPDEEYSFARIRTLHPLQKEYASTIPYSRIALVFQARERVMREECSAEDRFMSADDSLHWIFLKWLFIQSVRKHGPNCPLTGQPYAIGLKRSSANFSLGKWVHSFAMWLALCKLQKGELPKLYHIERMTGHGNVRLESWQSNKFWHNLTSIEQPAALNALVRVSAPKEAWDRSRLQGILHPDNKKVDEILDRCQQSLRAIVDAANLSKAGLQPNDGEETLDQSDLYRRKGHRPSPSSLVRDLGTTPIPTSQPRTPFLDRSSLRSSMTPYVQRRVVTQQKQLPTPMFNKTNLRASSPTGLKLQPDGGTCVDCGAHSSRGGWYLASKGNPICQNCHNYLRSATVRKPSPTGKPCMLCGTKLSIQDWPTCGDGETRCDGCTKAIARANGDRAHNARANLVKGEYGLTFRNDGRSCGNCSAIASRGPWALTPDGKPRCTKCTNGTRRGSLGKGDPSPTGESCSLCRTAFSALGWKECEDGKMRCKPCAKAMVDPEDRASNAKENLVKGEYGLTFRNDGRSCVNCKAEASRGAWGLTLEGKVRCQKCSKSAQRSSKPQWTPSPTGEPCALCRTTITSTNMPWKKGVDGAMRCTPCAKAIAASVAVDHTPRVTRGKRTAAELDEVQPGSQMDMAEDATETDDTTKASANTSMRSSKRPRRE